MAFTTAGLANGAVTPNCRFRHDDSLQRTPGAKTWMAHDPVFHHGRPVKY
jgi:hypothetical protein